MGPAERAPRVGNVRQSSPGFFAMRLNRGPSLCVYVAQISAVLLASCRQAGHGLYERLCFSGTPASPLTERGVPATSDWLVVPRQMVSQIGKRLLRIVRLMLTVHAMPPTGDNALAGSARQAGAAIVNIVLAVLSLEHG